MRDPKQKRIVLVGKSASGKDFFKSYCQEKGLNLEVSYTTRPKRPEEIEGVSYNYVDKFMFMSMAEEDKFYEYAHFNKNYYGTLMDSWMKSDVFIMTPGGINAIDEVHRLDCLIVYFDICESVRKERLMFRKDTNDTIKRRLKADDDDFFMFNDFDLRIISPEFNPDKLFDAIQKLREI